MNLVDDFIIWSAIGILIGSRLGYVLFYDFKYYTLRPLNIFLPFDFYNGFTFTGIFRSLVSCSAFGIHLWKAWQFFQFRTFREGNHPALGYVFPD